MRFIAGVSFFPFLRLSIIYVVVLKVSTYYKYRVNKIS